MRVWKLKLVREGADDIYIHYRKNVLPEMLTESWLQEYQKAIMKLMPDFVDATYEYKPGPKVYLRKIR